MFFTCSFLFSQKQHPSTELGLYLGVSYYLGDLNQTHFKGFVPDKTLFLDKKIEPVKGISLFLPALGLQYRRNFNHRLSFKTSFLYGYVESHDSKSNLGFNQDRNLSFRSDLFEISSQLEIYFHPINSKDKKRRISPYFSSGIALLSFNPKSYVAEINNWQNSSILNTEAQGKEDPITQQNIKDYKTIQLTIPLGIGVKWYPSENLSISLEWGMRATFTDYIDDVSTFNQPNSFSNDQGTVELFPNANAYNISNSGTGGTRDYRQRGFANTNDWYNFTGITISWLFQKPSFKCSD